MSTAYGNFKQTFWSKFIQHELEKRLILADFCNKKYQGEAKYGNVVKILGVGKPAIGNYEGTDIGTPENVADTSVFLTIDQAKYFNFMVDDVDEVQSMPGIMEALMQEAVQAMGQTIDSFIASKAANAGTLSTSLKIATAAEAKAAIDAGILALRENDVPIDEDVVAELPPFLYQFLKDKYIELDTANSEMLKKGIVGHYDNVRIRVSNNLYNDGTDYYGMIRTKNAIAYVNQIDKTEAYRPEGLFSDAVKGLSVYGAKVVRPKELYALKVHK